jgi:hypothetical protein
MILAFRILEARWSEVSNCSKLSPSVKLGPYNLTVGVEIVEGFTVVFRFHDDENPPPPTSGGGAVFTVKSMTIRADFRVFNICV